MRTAAPGAPPNSRAVSLCLSEVIAMFCSVRHCGPQAVDVTPVAKSHLFTCRVLGPALQDQTADSACCRQKPHTCTARPMGRKQTLSVSARLSRPCRSGR